MPGSTSTASSRARTARSWTAGSRDEVIYLSAMEEGRYTIAQANAEIDADGQLRRRAGAVPQGRRVRPGPARRRSTSIDVSPKQLVSVAAALIPFLENDDANRALMGSNMQRQAVPLIRPRRRWSAPAWKRWWPATAASPSPPAAPASSTRSTPRASSSARPSDVGPTAPAVDIYNLLKFQRSNQNTCITQRPLVKVGDQVQKGDIIADGPSTQLRRAGARPQRARRVHAVERLQLRGLRS